MRKQAGRRSAALRHASRRAAAGAKPCRPSPLSLPPSPNSGPTPARASTCLRPASTSSPPAAAPRAARSWTTAPTRTPPAPPWRCPWWRVRGRLGALLWVSWVSWVLGAGHCRAAAAAAAAAAAVAAARAGASGCLWVLLQPPASSSRRLPCSHPAAAQALPPRTLGITRTPRRARFPPPLWVLPHRTRSRRAASGPERPTNCCTAAWRAWCRRRRGRECSPARLDQPAPTPEKRAHPDPHPSPARAHQRALTFPCATDSICFSASAIARLAGASAWPGVGWRLRTTERATCRRAPPSPSPICSEFCD